MRLRWSIRVPAQEAAPGVACRPVERPARVSAPVFFSCIGPDRSPTDRGTT